MNRTVSLLLISIVSFMLGLFSAVAVYWILKTYLFPPSTITVRGVLQHQAQPVDLSASGNPPNGYYVESSAIDRFYVEESSAKLYVGSRVLIQGTLSTVCGPDNFPCYPQIVPKSITSTTGEP